MKWLAVSGLSLMTVGASLALLYSDQPLGSFADAANPLPYLQTTELWKQLAAFR
jgi:hypothetical protein